MEVRRQAEAEGLDKIFEAAGFEWRLPGCSMCLAMNDDRAAPGSRVASTSNRNFVGRQGRGSRTHLMSPAAAAAYAVANIGIEFPVGPETPDTSLIHSPDFRGRKLIALNETKKIQHGIIRVSGNTRNVSEEKPFPFPVRIFNRANQKIAGISRNGGIADHGYPITEPVFPV